MNVVLNSLYGGPQRASADSSATSRSSSVPGLQRRERAHRRRHNLVWTYTAANPGNINGQFFFQNFAKQNGGGGNANDTLNLSAWTGGMVFNITADNAGNVVTPSGTFQFAGIAHLRRFGAGRLRLQRRGGRHTGVYGGSGQNTLDMHQYTSPNIWSRDSNPGLVQRTSALSSGGDIQNCVGGKNTTFRFSMPDLVGKFQQMGLPATMQDETSGPIQLVVTNNGNIKVAAKISLAFYLSMDGKVDSSAVLIGQANNWSISLQPGYSQTWTGQVRCRSGPRRGPTRSSPSWTPRTRWSS